MYSKQAIYIENKSWRPYMVAAGAKKTASLASETVR